MQHQCSFVASEMSHSYPQPDGDQNIAYIERVKPREGRKERQGPILGVGGVRLIEKSVERELAVFTKI